MNGVEAVVKMVPFMAFCEGATMEKKSSDVVSHKEAVSSKAGAVEIPISTVGKEDRVVSVMTEAGEFSIESASVHHESSMMKASAATSAKSVLNSGVRFVADDELVGFGSVAVGGCRAALEVVSHTCRNSEGQQAR